MKLGKLYIAKNRHNKLLFNSLLWLFFFAVLLVLFADFPPKKIDIIYTLSYLLTLFFPVTLVLYYLLPKFLKKEKYLAFSLFFVTIILCFSFLNITFHQQLIDIIFPNYFFVSYLNNYQTIIVFILFTLLALFIKLTEDWIYFNQNEKLQIETRLNALKGQINPHFLFNSLNVLYSLSIENKGKTTDAILQLSEILRYIIYDINTDRISIKKEIELINNYINFEKNRHIKNSQILFNHSIKNDVEIYPMLLLPIIENAFKHGLKSGVKKPKVSINLYEENNKLSFIVENNYIVKSFKKEKGYSGIGLQNIKQNLEILYPKSHRFLIEKTDSLFLVKLQINF